MSDEGRLNIRSAEGEVRRDWCFDHILPTAPWLLDSRSCRAGRRMLEMQRTSMSEIRAES